jgi:hypothetical protein
MRTPLMGAFDEMLPMKIDRTGGPQGRPFEHPRDGELPVPAIFTGPP